MYISFYNNSSPNYKLQKDLQLIANLQGTLRDASDVIHPEILLSTNIINSNYAYIPEFARYYFIEEITNVRNDLWKVILNVDPLMSFSTSILNLPVILAETESEGADNYLADSRVWITKVKDKTTIIQFPNGLLQDGEFILITAGG